LTQRFLKRPAESAFFVTGFVAVFVILSASLIVYQLENRAPGANIVTGRDAIWWALVTISTVGYGDRYPVTAEGRLVAAILITFGVALFGVLTSFLATTFLESGQRNQEDDIAAIRAELAEIKQLLVENEGVSVPSRDDGALTH
jgi:voltage-gated potassium channel